ncbi:hypothetical protein BDA99DRAFT_289109 [Phascolomyces articulosus]|uniref:Uncharacterized protein n=1 Tax=Phascolomyces articulosus TaxID=60185 RepID=A0AAD5P7I5_9FUNG|nr:hypothetical protein BDA99DRAFT_289109 [Phascolomyces articulosus]
MKKIFAVVSISFFLSFFLLFIQNASFSLFSQYTPLILFPISFKNFLLYYIVIIITFPFLSRYQDILFAIYIKKEFNKLVV